MIDSTSQHSSQPRSTTLEQLKQFARECTYLAQNTPNAHDIFAQLANFQRNTCYNNATKSLPYFI